MPFRMREDVINTLLDNLLVLLIVSCITWLQTIIIGFDVEIFANIYLSIKYHFHLINLLLLDFSVLALVSRWAARYPIDTIIRKFHRAVGLYLDSVTVHLEVMAYLRSQLQGWLTACKDYMLCCKICDLSHYFLFG